MTFKPLVESELTLPLLKNERKPKKTVLYNAQILTNLTTNDN